MGSDKIRQDLNESIDSAMHDAMKYPNQRAEYLAEVAEYGIDLIRLEEGDL